MTWGKAWWILALAGVFDILRAMCEQMWFFGPALVGVTAGVATGSTTAGETVAGIAGVFGLATGESIEFFGLVLASAIGLLGWMVVGFLLVVFNPRMFANNAPGRMAALRFLLALLASETPLVGTVPALSAAVWSGYRAQMKREKEAYKKWEEENAAALRAARQEQQLAAIQMQQAAAAGEAARFAQAEVEEAVAESEIPDGLREAA